MGLILTIILGALAGLIAKAILPGRDPGGWIVTPLLGIGGAILMSYLGAAIGWYRPGQSAGFLGAIVGAVLILLLYRLVLRRRAGP